MSVTPQTLPARVTLDQLQAQAKELLRQLRLGEPEALGRFHSFIAAAEPGIADAQYVIAREFGFSTWAKLKTHIETTPNPFEEQALALIKADAMRKPHDARRMVAHSHGFLSWEKLSDASALPAFAIDWTPSRITVQGVRPVKEWERIFEVMQEYRITGISANGLTDSALKRLRQLDFVTELNLDGAEKITDEGLRHIAAMPQLRSLDLSGWHSAVTDVGLEALAPLQQLRDFKACWSGGMSDAGLGFLSGCQHLETVNLMGTATGDGALQALAGKVALRRLKTGKLVTDAGVALLQGIPAFQKWPGGELDYGLMAFESGPTHLLLDGPFTDAGLRALAGLDGLFGLTFFWHCPGFTSAGLAVLREMSGLGYVGCQGEHCDDEAMAQIAAVPRLRMLMGQGTVATDAGFEALSGSKTLEYFWGRECPNLTGRGFAALSKMESLRGLAASCKNVDDASLALLPQFPALREMMPMDFSDANFRHVGACANLEKLWCMYCRETGDAATAELTGLSKLRSYYAGKTQITDRSLELLSGMKSLQKLEFSQCAGVTEAGAVLLAGLPLLREVSFDGMPAITVSVRPLFAEDVRVRISG